MSLEDRFYSEDGTLMTRVDNSLIKATGKVGELYQLLTGRDAKELYYASLNTCMVMCATGSLLNHNPMMLSGTLFAYANKKMPRFCSPLEERLTAETALGIPRAYQIERLAGAALSVLLPAMSVYSFSQNVHAQEIVGLAVQLGKEAFAFSFVPCSFALYLSKSNIPKPPEKHVFTRAKEKLQKFFTPAPQPAPVPVSVNYATDL